MTIDFVEETADDYVLDLPQEIKILDFSINKTEASWENTVKTFMTKLTACLSLEQNRFIPYLWLKSLPYFNPSKLKITMSTWNNPDVNWLKKEQCHIFSHDKDNVKTFSSVALLEQTQFSDAANYSRNEKESFFFLSEHKIDEVFFDTFMFQNYSRLESIIDFLFRQNCIFIRTTGNFDDEKLNVDFLGERKLIENLQKNLHP